MAWVDVAVKIKLWGTDADGTPPTINGRPISTGPVGLNGYGNVIEFGAGDKTPILDVLSELYFGSPTARALLDAGTSGSDIWLANVTGQGSGAFPFSRTAGIDFTQATTMQWMGRDGRFQLEKLGGNIIHELIHAIDGTRDLLDPVDKWGRS